MSRKNERIVNTHYFIKKDGMIVAKELTLEEAAIFLGVVRQTIYGKFAKNEDGTAMIGGYEVIKVAKHNTWAIEWDELMEQFRKKVKWV